MKISLRWIEEILGVKIELPCEELSQILLHLGFEVASVQNYPKCTGVVLGEIEKISLHPNADRLRIVEVTDGRNRSALVCGAPNLTLGQRCLWAKEGAILADGKELKRATIRGVLSEGMLLSTTELGVGETSSGLWEFREKALLGTPLEDLVSLEDTLFDLEITPNRPDCLSHYGIARELAARLNLKAPREISFGESGAAHPHYSVIIENERDCPLYIARKLENVTVGHSPLAMQTRLTRCGIRPINNIVDITNSVLLEVGQPLHAFDADRLEGEEIFVRNGLEGESIFALDGKNYALDPEILVIADHIKPVAIAGVMGGEGTSVTSQTKNVLLESAVFKAERIRKNGTKLGLSSESSHRFERGVTHWSCTLGSLKASEAIEEFASASLIKMTKIGHNGSSGKMQTVKVAQVNRVLGASLTLEEISSQLQKLSIPIHFKDASKLEVESPPWRIDLEQEVDFIEEIARMKGYGETLENKEEMVLGTRKIQGEDYGFNLRAKKWMASLGFYECINYGLIGDILIKDPPSKADFIRLENPTSVDQSLLRPSLMPELFNNLKTNLSYQKKNIFLFEVGQIHAKIKDQFRETTCLGALACGRMQPPYWNMKEREIVNFFWMKGILQSLMLALTNENIEWEPLREEGAQTLGIKLHPRHSFVIRTAKDQRKIGIIGMVHPKRLKEEKITEEVACFELDMNELSSLTNAAKRYRPIPRTPKIERDCSLWVEEKIPWSEIESEILKVASSQLSDLKLFDLFKGKESSDKKSLNLTLTFRNPEKTMGDEEANHLRDKIIRHLEHKFKATLRQSG